jgi:diguanylate cyclase (GGDEF)-like protein
MIGIIATCLITGTLVGLTAWIFSHRCNEQLRRCLQYERHTARHDALTGLPNRLAMQEQATMLAAATPTVVLVIDLNDFKPINDTYGHEAGDHVLAVVADRLRCCLGRYGIVARLGGDEFAAIIKIPVLTSSHHEHWVRDLITAVAQYVAEPVVLDSYTVRISASIGAVINNNAVVTLRRLLHSADKAMYDAKKTHRPYAIGPIRNNPQHRPAIRQRDRAYVRSSLACLSCFGEEFDVGRAS